MAQGQHWDPERYARNARFVSELGTPLIELLSPRRGERVLDLGCGDGELTARLADTGCSVVGVDASAEQVAAARARGLDARVMDARRLEFRGEFDAVLSNAALHWIREADAVLAGVARALRPGGRFVAELGGEGNVRSVVDALTAALGRRGVDARAVSPWYFPGVEEYRGRLERAGFGIDSIALIPRPVVLPGDLRDWLETFAGSFSAALPEARRAAFLDEVRDSLRPRLCDAQGRWSVDYVRLRLRAVLPGAPAAGA